MDETFCKSINRRVGIIGGSGWIGRSLLQAMLGKGVLAADKLAISNTSGKHPFPDQWPQVKVLRDNQALAEACEVLIISVRPEQFSAVSIDAPNALIISMMVGISLQRLQDCTGSQRIIRAMPNAALEIGRGYIPWCASEAVSTEDKILARSLFASAGQTDEVADETLLDYLTGLSGTGPAYPALLAEALMEHALQKGLPAEVARRAANAVVVNASQMISRGRSSEALIQSLMDYKGVTAAGLREMIKCGFKQVVASGLDQAELKAQQMGSDPGQHDSAIGIQPDSLSR